MRTSEASRRGATGVDEVHALVIDAGSCRHQDCDADTVSRRNQLAGDVLGFFKVGEQVDVLRGADHFVRS